MDHFDTLSGMCLRYSTRLEDVVSQNRIEDPDLILIGQLLHYDSRKTEDGKHPGTLLDADLTHSGYGY